MFAVDHAATALLIKRRFPSAPLPPLLLSVQAMELAWVALNYAGIERTTTEPVVRSVADVHLAYMPYSHSVAIAAGGALIVWLVLEKGFRRATLGRAVGLGIVSHLVLDLLTHATDIVLYPGSSIAFGAGLYDRAPMWGFALEMVYGLVLLASLPRRASVAGARCARQPREPVAVLRSDSRTGTISRRSPIGTRHADPRPDRDDAGAGQRVR
jgi:hypothetical protein